MKRFLAMVAIAAAFAVQSVVSTPALAADARLTADGRIPVVFHVTNKDPLMWNQALNNAANYQAIMGKDKVFTRCSLRSLSTGLGSGCCSRSPKWSRASRPHSRMA